MHKKACSFLLMLYMVLTLAPTASWAAEPAEAMPELSATVLESVPEDVEAVQVVEAAEVVAEMVEIVPEITAEATPEVVETAEAVPDTVKSISEDDMEIAEAPEETLPQEAMPEIAESIITAEIEPENTPVASKFSDISAYLLALSYVRPVSPWNITRTFAKHSKQGLDIGVSVGTPVYATAPGTVVTAIDRGCQGSHHSDAAAQNRCPLGNACPAYKANPGSNGSYANYIIINHGNNIYSLYAHLQTGSFKVSQGQQVNQGQQIASSGTAGNATGPHLHLEFRLGNSYSNQVNPEDYIGNSDPVPVPAPAVHEPQILLDAASSPGAGKLYVKGWAYDPDNTAKSLEIHIYAGSGSDNGSHIAVVTANKSRPDVDNVYHCGTNHGFENTINVSVSGNYTIRAAALGVNEAGNGDGLNTFSNGTAVSISVNTVPVIDDGGSPYEGDFRLDPVIYNQDFYRAAHPDLVQAFGSDDAALRNHWLTSGIAEGRQASQCFCINWYTGGVYPDLTGYQNDHTGAIQHFLSYGIPEGRAGSEHFDLGKYKANYQDLQNAFGNDNYKYCVHFIDHGWGEGRIANRRITVNFNANGGSCSTGNQPFTLCGQYGTLPTPARTNYSFNGWWTDANGGTRILSSTIAELPDNHTLYAHWSRNTYTITFDANGGSVSPTSLGLSAGGVYNSLPVPVRENFTFNGWWTDVNGGEKITEGSGTVTANRTLYAHWSQNTYTSEPFTDFLVYQPEYYRSKYFAELGKMSDQELEAHWLENGINERRQASPVFWSEYYLNHNEDLKTAFGAKNYQKAIEHFISDGVNERREFTSPEFNVRYYAANYKDLQDKFGDSYYDYYKHFIEFGSEKENRIATSRLTVKFDANGGTCTPTSQNYTCDAPYGNLPAPTRNGYKFDGWYTLKTGGDKITEDTTARHPREASHTIYAHWTANKYTVTFNVNGGSSVSHANTQVTFDSTYGDLPTPTRSGYRFDGWYTAASGGSQITKDSKVTITAAQTLYAHWTTLYLNVGTNFDAFIYNTFSGRYLTNEDSQNVTADSRSFADAQIWHFERLDDGSYKITSLKDGKSLDVLNYGTKSGTNVQLVDYKGNTAQMWYICGEAGAYTIGAKCTPCMMDIENNGGDATSKNVYMWEANGTAAQKFTIEKDIVPQRSLISIEIARQPDKTIYQVGETWNGTGLTVKANYSDGTSEILTEGFSINGFDSSVAGEKTVTVTYSEKTATFTVTVQAPSTPPVDENAPQIVIENQTVSPGSTFDVPVLLKNNPGLIAYRFSVGYDSEKLELVSVADGNFANVPAPLDRSPYIFNWSDGTGGNSTGSTVGVMTFRVKDNAKGTTLLSITIDDPDEIFNADDETVLFSVADAGITIREFMTGDANGDGKINTRDVVLLQRHLSGWNVEIVLNAADANGDSKVNTRDTVLLQRYLSGWDVTLGPAVAQLMSMAEDEPSVSEGKTPPAQIVVEERVANAGDVISIPVKFVNNPGLNAYRFGVKYDTDKLELLSVTDGDYANIPAPVDANPYTFNWTDGTAANDKTDDMAGIMTFHVREDAAGMAEFEIVIYDEEDFSNVAGDVVAVVAVGGALTIV